MHILSKLVDLDFSKWFIANYMFTVCIALVFLDSDNTDSERERDAGALDLLIQELQCR